MRRCPLALCGATAGLVWMSHCHLTSSMPIKIYHYLMHRIGIRARAGSNSVKVGLWGPNGVQSLSANKAENSRLETSG